MSKWHRRNSSAAEYYVLKPVLVLPVLCRYAEVYAVFNNRNYWVNMQWRGVQNVNELNRDPAQITYNMWVASLPRWFSLFAFFVKLLTNVPVSNVLPFEGAWRALEMSGCHFLQKIVAGALHLAISPAPFPRDYRKIR